MSRKLLFIICLIGTLFAFTSCLQYEPADAQTGMVSFGTRDEESSLSSFLKRDLTDSTDGRKAIEELYWTYSAEKIDKGFAIGAQSNEAAINKGRAGLSGSIGPFSTGKWRFTLSGYVDQNHKTVYYSGTNDDVLIENRNDNTVYITVKYQRNAAQGTLRLSNIGLTEDDVRSKVDRVYAIVYNKSNGEIVKTFSDLTQDPDSLLFFTENDSDSNKSAVLDPGAYTVEFLFYSSEEAYEQKEPSFKVSKDITISNSMVLTLSGNLNYEGSTGGFTFDIQLEDDTDTNDSYWSYSIGDQVYLMLKTDSGEEALKEALSYDSPACIYIQNDITLTQTIDVNKDGFELDLQGYTISAEAIPLFSVEDGCTFTISNGILANNSDDVALYSGNVILKGVNND